MLTARNTRYFGAFFAAVSGLGLSVAIAACGQSVHFRHHRLRIALSEYRLRPSQIIAPSGTLTVTLTNLGRLTHNLVVATGRPHPRAVTRTGTTATETTTVVARSPDLAPGASTTLRVSLAPGRYRLRSSVASDASLGAEGTLTVTSK